jgi:transposase InsO family protein
MLSRWRKEYREGKIVVDKRKKVTDVKNQKAELIRDNIFNYDLELRYAVGNYIIKYYNAKRLHLGIDYCSPIEYETLAA